MRAASTRWSRAGARILPDHGHLELGSEEVTMLVEELVGDRIGARNGKKNRRGDCPTGSRLPP